MSDPDPSRWERRVERERAARKAAEQLLEEKSLELFHANQALLSLTADLERQVAARTEELQQALARAEAATRAKSDFLATMSHEIRTPMHAILGMVQLLERSALDGQQQQYVATIRSSGDSLLTLINDILDFSKIEAGKLELESAPFDLGQEVSSVVDLFRPGATEKGLTLEARMPPSPIRVVGDRTRLRQILSNLLSNAVRFTRVGGVVLSVVVSPLDADTRVRVELSVADSGVGIPAGKMDRLFQAFSQVDASISRQHGGTGLGLVICARLARAMEGDISVESTPGRGSTFRVILPLPPAPAAERAPEQAPAAEEALAPLRVLIVEDNPINRLLALRLLQLFGISAHAAENGREAVDLATVGQYDLILMDMSMPDLDGIEATREIRSLPLARQPAIIALTASAFAGDRDACARAGMDDFLSKPFRAETLRAKISQVIARRAHPGGAADAG